MLHRAQVTVLWLKEIKTSIIRFMAGALDVITDIIGALIPPLGLALLATGLFMIGLLIPSDRQKFAAFSQRRI